MPNRVIKESICRSKSLAKCSLKAQDQFYKFLLFADDWGCFKVDYKKMKDDLFSYRKDIGIDKIESFLGEYKEHGMLFFWDNKDKVYGFFVNWDDQTGEYLSRRGKRKTPEPPKKDVEKYTTYFNSLQVTSNGFKLLHRGSSDSGKERKGKERKRKESESESESELKGKEKNKSKSLVGSQKTEPTGERKPSPPKKKSDPRVTQLLRFWGWEFDEHLRTTYTASFKRDGKLLKLLLESVGNNHRVPDNCTVEFIAGCISWYLGEQKEKEEKYLKPDIPGFYKNFNRICVEVFREEIDWKELKEEYGKTVQEKQGG